MKNILIIMLIQFSTLACSIDRLIVNTKLYQEQFPGFDFSSLSNTGQPVLSGYEYQTTKGGNIVVTSCQQAKSIDISEIANYDYFRFKLLLVSCAAINTYSMTTASRSSNFPAKLDADFIYQLPAAIIPLLSQTDAVNRQGLSIKSYDNSTHISLERENTFKLLNKENQMYFTLMARGDFTHDGFEDLLVQTEWSARNAYGKHVDLLILSRVDKDEPVKISWRLNKLSRK